MSNKIAGSVNRFTKPNSSILLASMWCLVSIVFIHAYIGTFISFLTFPKLKPVISSLQDLPSSKLNWVLDRGTSLDSLFLVCIKTTRHKHWLINPFLWFAGCKRRSFQGYWRRFASSSGIICAIWQKYWHPPSSKRNFRLHSGEYIQFLMV